MTGALVQAILPKGSCYVSIPENLGCISFEHSGMFSKRVLTLDEKDHSTFALLLGHAVTYCSTHPSRTLIGCKFDLHDGRTLQVTWTLVAADMMVQELEFEGQSERFYLTRVPCIPTEPSKLARFFAKGYKDEEERGDCFQWIVPLVVRETYMLPLIKELMKQTSPHDLATASW